MRSYGNESAINLFAIRAWSVTGIIYPSGIYDVKNLIVKATQNMVSNMIVFLKPVWSWLSPKHAIEQ